MSTSLILPVFPLQMVAFPYEEVALHIFEPRYRKLIASCEDDGTSFVLVPIVDEKISQLGTVLKLKTIVKRYEDGRMDVICRGTHTFKIEKFLAEPSYAQAHRGSGMYIERDDTSELVLQERLLTCYTRLHTVIHTERQPALHAESPLSYQIAHTCGMNAAQQVKLLELNRERDRLQFLIKHLENVLPILDAIQKTKEKATENSSFQEVPGGSVSLN